MSSTPSTVLPILATWSEVNPNFSAPTVSNAYRVDDVPVSEELRGFVDVRYRASDRGLGVEELYVLGFAEYRREIFRKIVYVLYSLLNEVVVVEILEYLLEHLRFLERVVDFAWDVTVNVVFLKHVLRKKSSVYHLLTERLIHEILLSTGNVSVVFCLEPFDERERFRRELS